MRDIATYTEFIRKRITELRLEKGVAEYRMSLELGKSGSYIRGITNGASLPSVKEMFSIIDYFGIGPVEFFAPLEDDQSPRTRLRAKLLQLNDAELQKVDTFISWITEENCLHSK